MQKNGVLTPKDVKPKSNRKVWWICEKGHEWEAIIADRTSGKGCPICSGKKVLYGYNDLATNCPEIAEQWNELKNGDLTPQKVTIGSHKKVWWRCNSGHEWQACICDRVNGNGCPYCSGRVAITGINDFSTLYPELVKEWDYEKNGELLPNTVKAHSNIKVWWICELRHSWQAVISDRAEESGCPFCQAEFKTSFPEQAVLFYLRQFTEAENRFKIGKNEIDVYLADYRSANDDEHFYLKDWQWVDLSSLGAVKKVKFSVQGSRGNTYGQVVPLYFCLDNFNGFAPLAGDVNGDGEVNVTDVSLTRSFILGNTPATFIKKQADMNGDGEVNVTDLSKIKNIILGNNE